MVALLISIVVVVAIGVVTVEVMTEVRKPATESPKSRRHAREGSRPKPLTAASKVGRRAAAQVGVATATAGRAVTSTRGGRTIVDSGRQIGHSIAELAKSSIAIAPQPATDETEADEDEVRGEGEVVPLAGSPEVGAADEIRDNGHPPISAEAPVAQSDPSARSAPVRRPTVAYADERYEEVWEPVDATKRERLYPHWWQRILSFVLLALIIGVVGIIAGTAIGAFLAFLYRLVTDSL